MLGSVGASVSRLVSEPNKCPLAEDLEVSLGPQPSGVCGVPGTPACLPVLAALAGLGLGEKHLILSWREALGAGGGISLSSGARICSNPEIAPAVSLL